MNKNIKLHLIFFCIFCQYLISCQKTTNDNVFLASNTEFITFETSKKLSGERILVQNFGARNIHIIDTFIVFMTPQLDSLYSIVSTETYNHLGNYVNKGNGPSEFLFALEPLSSKKAENKTIMSLYNFHERKLIDFNITQSVELRSPIFMENNNIKPMSGVYKVHQLNDEYLFVDYLNINDLTQHYAKYHLASNELEDDFQAITSGLTDQSLSYLLATSTAFNLQKKKYVSAMKFIDQINFYNLDKPLQSESFSIHENNLKMEEVENIPMPDKMEYYVDLRSDSSYVYGLYVNQNRKDWAMNEKPGVIHVFDWNGLPICELKTEEKLIYFDIDSKNKKLYGLTIDEDLFVYDLKGISELN